jgi:hypothetical protein
MRGARPVVLTCEIYAQVTKGPIVPNIRGILRLRRGVSRAWPRAGFLLAG